MQAELDAAATAVIMFAQFDFDGGTQRYCTAGHNVEWNSQTWYGVTAPMTIGEVRESESLESIGVPITLNGLPTSIVSQVLSENMLGRAVTCWFGVIDSSGAIVADPVVEFDGRCDSPTIAIEGGVAAIRFTVESRMAKWSQAINRRYTDADQQAAYAGDLGLQYVPQMVEKTLVFPARSYFT